MIGNGSTSQRDGVWVALSFLLFGAVVLGANGALIWYAAASWPGLVTESPYDKGLTYNRNLEAAARQADLGWQTRLTARLTGALDGEAALDLRDRSGALLAGAAPSGGCSRHPAPGRALCRRRAGDPPLT